MNEVQGIEPGPCPQEMGKKRPGADKVPMSRRRRVSIVSISPLKSFVCNGRRLGFPFATENHSFGIM
jgi:hypothetical protein